MRECSEQARDLHLYTIIHVPRRQTLLHVHKRQTYKPCKEDMQTIHYCRVRQLMMQCIHWYYTAPSSTKTSSSIHNNLVVDVYVVGSSYFELEWAGSIATGGGASIRGCWSLGGGGSSSLSMLNCSPNICGLHGLLVVLLCCSAPPC